MHPLMHDLACFVAKKGNFSTMGLLHKEGSDRAKRYDALARRKRYVEAAVRKKGLVDEEASAQIQEGSVDEEASAA